MSEYRKIGAERCMMRSPNGAGMFVKGGGKIRAKLDAGWTIVPNDFRNHLLPSRFATPENGKEETRATIGLDPVKTETWKRPRIKRK